MQGIFPILRTLLRLHSLARLGRAAALLAAGAANCLAADSAPPVEVAPGVYVMAGAAAAADARNQGRIGNQGIIVGSGGLIVIGTGTSDVDGERLLAALGRFGGATLLLVINTHAAAEHVLGNSAFARRGIPILAHRETDRYMAANCDICIGNLRAVTGDAPLSGTRLERPTRLIEGSTSLSLAGRRLEILHFGATQQPGALAVFDAASGVLFAGGLASFDVLPDARDADLSAWRNALHELRKLPLRHVVPGRGPVGAPQRLDEVAAYLDALERETARAYRRGLSLGEAVRAVRLPRFEHWALYQSLHPRNVHHQFLRLEAQELER